MKIMEDNFVFQLKKRNEKALEYVIDNYSWIIKSIVKKNLYNLEGYQEECINDILLGIWNNIDRFNGEKSTFQNWVAGIARYKTIDYRRKYLKDLKNKNIDHVEIASQDSIDKDIIRKDLKKDLDNMLKCLKKEDRELFVKLYIEQDKIDYISRETGLKRDVIYNRISRGKRKIRKIFNIRGRV